MILNVILNKMTKDMNCNYGEFAIIKSQTANLTGEQTPCETYEADAERSNPEKWITPIEFHTRLENKYPWLS